MVTLFRFTKHNKDKMLILVHREMNVLYIWLDSSIYMYSLQSYGESPITSGPPLIFYVLFIVHKTSFGNMILKVILYLYEIKKPL